MVSTTNLSASRFTWIGVVCCLLLVFSPSLAMAQKLQDKRNENVGTLEGVNRLLDIGKKRTAELKQEIALLKNDRARIADVLIETASRIQRLETNLTKIEIRLGALTKQQAETKATLLKRRNLLSQVLAALQRMGRKPPPALLVRPEDALASVRSAILLGAVVPEMRSQTKVLIADLQELARLRQSISKERSIHATHIKSLLEDNVRLSLLVDQKLKLQGRSQSALHKQNREVRQLAKKATSLAKLIATLDAQIKRSDLLAKAAIDSSQAHQNAASKRLSNARSRASGEIDGQQLFGRRFMTFSNFNEAKGRLQLPVRGVEVLSFGQNNLSGTKSKGALLATRANALVVSPADARVVYAGPFRSYGELLILDLGDQVHIVLAGMELLTVGTGQFVLTGEPVAKMGSRRIAGISAVDIASTRPMLYVEFRRSGKSFDPTPWWVDVTAKRSDNDT